MRSGRGAFVFPKKGSTAAMFDSSSGHIASYYAASSLDRQILDLQIQRTSLQENLAVDVLIIGAGFTGLYTALRLAAAGKHQHAAYTRFWRLR
jgi:NADH dehydrogenase FAD-containing subunit